MGRFVRITDGTVGVGVTRARKAQILTGGLARDRTPGFEDTGHECCIDIGHKAFEQRRSVHQRNASNADIILDRYGLPRQQSVILKLDISFPIPGVVGVFFRIGAIARIARRYDGKLGLW